MGSKSTSRITMVVIQDAARPVRAFRIPKPLVVAIPAACAAVLAGAALWYWHMHQSDREQIASLRQAIGASAQEHARQIGQRDETIRMLQDDLLSLSEQADAFRRELDHIRLLERELREIVERSGGEFPADLAASSVPYATPAGGEFRTGSQEQLSRFADRIQASLTRANDDLRKLPPLLEDARAALERLLEERARTPSVWPTASRNVTSGFGFRRDPFTGRSAHHDGIDIAGEPGDLVVAAAKGTVERTGRDALRGNYVVVSHGGEIHSVYMHLLQASASAGQLVEKGDVIGTLGSTGRSTGPHLHYEVHVSGQPVDPAAYLGTTD